MNKISVMTVMFIVCWVGRGYGCDPQEAFLVPASAHTAPGPSTLDLMARVGMQDPLLLEALSKMARGAHKAALAQIKGGPSLQEDYQQLLVTIDEVPRRPPSFSEPIYLWIGGERGPRGSDEPLTAGETLKVMCDQMRALCVDSTPHGDA